MFFKKSAPHPDEVCPQCQGTKSRTMRVCTTCSLRATRAPDAPGPVPAQRADARPPPATTGPYSLPPASLQGPGPATATTAAPLPSGGGYRTDQGVVVRTQAERDVANFLWRNRILFAYEYTLVGKQVAFFLPDASVILDRRGGGYDARRSELQALGHTVLPLPESDIDRALKAGLARAYPGRTWQ